MRKTFSITDKEVLDKLDEVESQSQYIQGLVIKDIYTRDASSEYESGVLMSITMIEKCLKVIKDSVNGSTEKWNYASNLTIC